MKNADKKFYTYLILTVDNKLYCGYTDDPEKRFEKHKAGLAAKYTRAHKPLKMVYIKEFDTKSEAMKEECRIKTLTRKQKEELCCLNCPRKIRDKEQSDVNEFLECHIEKVSSDGYKARVGNCDTRLEKKTP